MVRIVTTGGGLSEADAAEAIAGDGPLGDAARAAFRSQAVPLAPGQDGRRKAISELLLATAGPWYLKRRNASEYRLTRDIGGGQYADFQLRRNFDAPGGYNTVHALNDIVTGIPLVAVEEGTAATVYSGTWGPTSRYANNQLPPPDFGFEKATATVTTAAGSTSVTVTSAALAPTSQFITRVISIPGAGEGGADYVGTIANVANGGVTIVASPAPATAVTGATATIYPALRTSNVTGATATYTSPAGTTRLGCIISTSGAGGLATVSVDGDLTAANCLLTAQDVVDSGRYPASILTTGGGTIAPTTRVIDFYTAGERWMKWTAIADGLDAAVHTVVLTVTGIKRTASVSTRAYLFGWGHGTGAETPMTSGAYVFGSSRVGSDSGTHELALEHLPAVTGATTAGFVGGKAHGYEDQPGDLSITLDGVATTLADGEGVLVTGLASLTRTSNLYHPQNTTTVCATDKITWTLRPDGLVVSQTLTWQVASTVSSAYLVQFSINSRRMDRVQLDLADTEYDLDVGADGRYLGVGRNTGAVWWDSTGDAAAAVLLPAAQQVTGNWSEDLLQVSVRNLADEGGQKLAKLYARRVGSAVPGEVWVSQATYLVGRLPGSTSDHLPVTAA